MYKFLFELATDPLGLPIEWYYEYLILVVINWLAYKLAYSKVGDLYNGGFISGRGTGSFLHWLIRFVFFVVIWAVTYFVVLAGKFVLANREIIVMSLCGISLTVIICVSAAALMRFINKKKAVDKNG